MIPATQRIENTRTLAAALGLDDEQAAPLLDQRIRITWDPASAGAAQVGEEVVRTLRQTFSAVVGPEAVPEPCRVELVINGVTPRASSGIRAYCWIDDVRLRVGDDGTAPKLSSTFPHPLLTLVAACYAAAWTARAALGANLGGLELNPIEIDFAAFSPDSALLSRPLEIGHCHLAGAGAIGSSFVYALRLLNVFGSLQIIDPKAVTDGILNRCVWFEAGDINGNKADVLVRRAQPSLPNLSLAGYVGTVADYRKGHQVEIERLIVGVDSRRARRSLQTELPREVFDASTTGIEEVVFHYNQQPSKGACLACIYPRTTSETTHEQHVADLLNISLVDVAAGFVSESAGTRILARYPNLTRDDVVGRAYDSLFKALCATAQLRTSENRQVLAPFGFVSMLAGAVLALEFSNRLGGGKARSFNNWRISPWANPNPDLQLSRPRIPTCEVCSSEDYESVASDLWQRASNVAQRGEIAKRPYDSLDTISRLSCE